MARAKKNSPPAWGSIVVRPQDARTFAITPEIVSAEASKGGLLVLGSASVDAEFSGGLPGFFKARIRILRLFQFFGKATSRLKGRGVVDEATFNPPG